MMKQMSGEHKQKFSLSGQRSSRDSKFKECEIKELVSRLQALLPQANRTSKSRGSVTKILKETCSHINRLHKEAEDLGERLAELLDYVDISDIDKELLRRLLQH